jgi:hypothetical protein
MNRRAARLVALALVLALPALAARCGARERREEPAGDATSRAAEPIDRTALDVRQAFEQSAARARNDLEDARQAAEAILARGALSGEAADMARERARLALVRGSEVLREAVRDGGERAAGWARLIQDRMMRLEQTLDALSGADREHADS